jgi:16S rRNA pseudouridine516 synthase
VKEDADRVQVDGKAIVYRKYVYLMMNKPQGYLSATEDDRDPVVTDILPEDYKRFELFPVGRLDKDTEGLLILTNDGQFAHALSSPKKKVYKRYFAVLDKPARAEDVEAFKAGMEFKEFTAMPAVLELGENPCEVHVEIAEGKFHQVKRMCERVGKNVTFLKRVAVGKLELDAKLGLGEVRELSAEELERLKP